MTQIIRDQRIVTDDWCRLDDAAPLPAAGRVIVSLARWRAETPVLKARGDVGVAIPSELDVAELQDDLPHLPLIALYFVFIQPRPEGGRTFDGRAYSQARVLRERHGFRGEIRATGDVFRDSMFYMHRCGINAFEVKPGQDLDDALNAFKDFTLHYQGAADDPIPLFHRRRQADT
ncbi:MAG: DUF934 domain-containing protein [Nevskiales bacterium]|nr:DUF934 domain-containing protein [Nevskiales bacterium]